MTNDITKKNYFEALVSFCENYDGDFETISSENMLAFATHELELLNRRKTSKKATANQIANDGIGNAILDVLGHNPQKLYTITEIIKAVPECAELTNQKVTSIVTKLVDNEKLEKVVEKRRSYFQIAE